MGGDPTTDEVSAEIGVFSGFHVALERVPPQGEDPDVFLGISTTRGNLVEGWRVLLNTNTYSANDFPTGDRTGGGVVE